MTAHPHCKYNLNFTLVLKTKDNKSFFNEAMLSRVKEIIQRLSSENDIELTGFDGHENHIKLNLLMHPNLTPSKFINSLKTVTSRYLRKEFPIQQSQFYYKERVIWDRGYCLVTSGDFGQTIDAYLANEI
ncbi:MULTISPECIES: IS200/IS605 family transposase [Acinetobacter]|uniref:IS200/IS605 family transposase n=1 Tax=Acinetobacter indicus TaxID=756892 RepID=A0A6C0Y3I7_9GAMM|nr:MULTISPECIES: IS200/IS605 family transposase [Acinetobacter]MDM1292518.1 IS200/IS605 family transposase [Acinetobacter indicus]MDM1322550.1 IS200/IS605 family transposase [Acinetobacter indicus]MDM1334292.1 IS200/IS605 family transposase [Acinetobacter indicus]QFS16895.1 IS200/IS605 family transposase [Acinetobacter indicus]QIC70688.1 IS200/IS605 family transposase [Acinetobacter indicus]